MWARQKIASPILITYIANRCLPPRVSLFSIPRKRRIGVVRGIDKLDHLEKIMTLLEAVSALDSLDGDATIYAAEPWTESAGAIISPEPDTQGLSTHRDA